MIATIRVALKRKQEMAGLAETVGVQEKKIRERKLVEKAKGIVMKTNGISEEEAYGYLRSVSMDKRLPMAEVAQAVIRSHELLNGKAGGRDDG